LRDVEPDKRCVLRRYRPAIGRVQNDRWSRWDLYRGDCTVTMGVVMGGR
jgi:hypothetical protein